MGCAPPALFRVRPVTSSRASSTPACCSVAWLSLVLAAARADSASRSCDHASLTFSFAALARAFASRSALFTSAFFARSSLFSSFTCGTEGGGGCEYDAMVWGVTVWCGTQGSTPPSFTISVRFSYFAETSSPIERRVRSQSCWSASARSFTGCWW